MSPKNQLATRRLLAIVALVLSVLCIIRVVQTVRSIHSSGTLVVNSEQSDANIIISQSGQQALYLGTGSLTVRLHPGIYTLSSESSGTTIFKQIQLRQGQTTTQTMDTTTKKDLPSQSSSNFTNTSILVDKGLSAEQLSYFEDLIYQYKPDAKTIAINAGSVQMTPHNSESDDPFVFTFLLTLDSVPLSATLQYYDLDSIQLTLTDSSGAKLFTNSAPITPER